MGLAPDNAVTIWVLTAFASGSSMLNMLFLKMVLGDIRDLRRSRHDHAQKLQAHETDLEWLKRELKIAGG